MQSYIFSGIEQLIRAQPRDLPLAASRDTSAVAVLPFDSAPSGSQSISAAATARPPNDQLASPCFALGEISTPSSSFSIGSISISTSAENQVKVALDLTCYIVFACVLDKCFGSKSYKCIRRKN